MFSYQNRLKNGNTYQYMSRSILPEARDQQVFWGIFFKGPQGKCTSPPDALFFSWLISGFFLDFFQQPMLATIKNAEILRQFLTDS